MAPGPPLDRGDSGWTPRGRVVASLMALLAVLLILSHFGVSTAVLLGAGAVGVLAALIGFYRLPADANGERRNNDD